MTQETYKRLEEAAMSFDDDKQKCADALEAFLRFFGKQIQDFYPEGKVCPHAIGQPGVPGLPSTEPDTPEDDFTEHVEDAQ